VQKQAHLFHARLPISDYANDTKGVLDQAPRVLSALVDTAALLGLLHPTLALMRLGQSLTSAVAPDADPLQQLPGLSSAPAAARIRAAAATAIGDTATSLRALLRMGDDARRRALAAGVRSGEAAAAAAALARLPLVELRAELMGGGEGGGGGGGGGGSSSGSGSGSDSSCAAIHMHSSASVRASAHLCTYSSAS